MSVTVQNTSAVGRRQPKPRYGLMQQKPLLISSLLEHAERIHPNVELVSRLFEEGDVIHRTTYGAEVKRCRKLANLLINDLDVVAGDVIGSLASNSFRHYELYLGVPAMGAVLHTLNPRYSLEQLEYIINHGEDRIIFVDVAYLPILKSVLSRGKCLKVEEIVVLTSERFMPKEPNMRLKCYETLMDKQSDKFQWPTLDENYASGLCYTSGTTGLPKGVLYSHRSTVLHAWSQATTENMGINNSDCALVNVPYFHAAGWGLPFVCTMVGAKMILPGTQLDAVHLCAMLRTEGDVTLMVGVPTIFQNIFEHVERHPDLQASINFRQLRIYLGGSAPTRALLKMIFATGAKPYSLWGMTETSPVGTNNCPQQKHQNMTQDELVEEFASCGRPPFGMELAVMDEQNRILPNDGKTAGNLMCRGPWVTRQYMSAPTGNTLEGDWFPTGDVSTIDAAGYMRITDRSKDVIKSGGEWISSLDLENAACSHPSVSAAAVIAVAHTVWQERPLLIVVRKHGTQHQNVSAEDILHVMRPKLPKWWMPDAVEFVDALPLTATGKVSKLTLRKRFEGYLLTPVVKEGEDDRPQLRASAVSAKQSGASATKIQSCL